MISPQDLQNKLRNLANSLWRTAGSPQIQSSLKKSTLARLCPLTLTTVFNSHDHKELNFFSKKYDISLKLFSHYDEKGRKLRNEELGLDWLQLFAGLLYLRVLFAIDQDASDIDLAKYLNVCFKAFEHINLPDFLIEENAHLDDILDTLFTRLPVKYLHDKAISPREVKVIEPESSDTFTILPIDVLFYEGPIARAYLETLYSLKCKPRSIVNLIAEHDLVSKKTVGQFLPRLLRQKYAATVQSRKIHHWPQYLFRTQQKLCLELFENLQKTLKIEHDTLWGLVNLRPLQEYSDNIIPFSFKSLKDLNLVNFIKAHDSSMYLFTGGGIIPQSFFDLENTRFLHIHPAHLPEMRGADCLLWSLLFSDHPSATCFYMNSGIDTGDIINAVFLPKITIPTAFSQLDDKTKYRLLYSFVDPWIRSVVLRDTLHRTDCFRNVTASHQSIDSGKTFHFMHQNIVKKVIAKTLTYNG